MKYLDYNFTTADINLTKKELEILCDTLNVICDEINIYEFETRISIPREQVIDLRNKIGRIIINMNQRASQDELKIATYLDDVWLLCPYCSDAWESSNLTKKVVICSNCKKKSYNPRYHTKEEAPPLN